MNNLFPPMSPILADKIPVGSDWAYQLKWDGVRIITELNGQQVKLYSKNGQPKEHVYPAVVHTLQSIGVRGVFDGEMIVFDPVTKRPDFGKILTLEKQRGRQQDRTHPAIYVLFDLLALNGM